MPIEGSCEGGGRGEEEADGGKRETAECEFGGGPARDENRASRARGPCKVWTPNRVREVGRAPPAPPLAHPFHLGLVLLRVFLPLSFSLSLSLAGRTRRVFILSVPRRVALSLSPSPPPPPSLSRGLSPSLSPSFSVLGRKWFMAVPRAPISPRILRGGSTSNSFILVWSCRFIRHATSLRLRSRVAVFHRG